MSTACFRPGTSSSYVPDAANVVGGLTQAQMDQVESLAARIADAVSVRRIGTPFDAAEAVSNVKTYGEGSVMIWFLEDYLRRRARAARGAGCRPGSASTRPWARRTDIRRRAALFARSRSLVRTGAWQCETGSLSVTGPHGVYPVSDAIDDGGVGRERADALVERVEADEPSSY
jgi:hypothetical protein